MFMAPPASSACGGMVYMITDLTTYHREYYRIRRQRLLDYLGNRCAVCGTTEGLEFDHIQPHLKSFEIKNSLSLTDVVKAELDKCQLLCNKHHLQKTISEKQPFRHGTRYGWLKKKCQYVDCGAKNVDGMMKET